MRHKYFQKLYEITVMAEKLLMLNRLIDHKLSFITNKKNHSHPAFTTIFKHYVEEEREYHELEKRMNGIILSFAQPTHQRILKKERSNAFGW